MLCSTAGAAASRRSDLVEFSAMTPAFDYKYIIRDADSAIRWEKRGNRRFLSITSDIVVYHE
jgi:hypothetical protein